MIQISLRNTVVLSIKIIRAPYIYVYNVMTHIYLNEGRKTLFYLSFCARKQKLSIKP